MITKLHEHLNRTETVDLLAVENMLHVLARDQVLIHVLLDLCQLTANHLNQLWGKVLCIQGVDATQYEFIDSFAHIILDIHHLSLLRLCRIGLSSTKNGKEHFLPEFFLSTKNSRIREVDHGEELLQVVLHRGTGKKDSAFDWKRSESHGSLVFTVLQTVCLVTHQEITALLVLVESTNMSSNGFVAYNKNVEHLSADKEIQILLDRLSVRLGKCHRLDSTSTKPLDKFILPILDQRARAHDNDSLSGRFTIRRDGRLEQGVDEGDGLQSFTKPHVVGKDTTVALKVLESHDAFVHELYSLALMRTKPLC